MNKKIQSALISVFYKDGLENIVQLLAEFGVTIYSTGGTQSYNFRLDLRVVYQAVCANHPTPDEPPYPLWQGLPLSSSLTRAELATRIDACTGVRKKAAERSS